MNPRYEMLYTSKIAGSRLTSNVLKKVNACTAIAVLEFAHATTKANTPHTTLALSSSGTSPACFSTFSFFSIIATHSAKHTHTLTQCC